MARVVVSMVAVALLLGGPMGSRSLLDAASPPSTSGSSASLFDQVWEDFDRNYSHFDLRSIDWNAMRERFRPRFEPSLTADQFATALAEMLRELEDLHVSLQRPDGSYVDVFAHQAEHNYTSQPRNRYRVSAYSTLGNQVVWHAMLQGNIAYLRIDTFETEAFSTIGRADIDALFAQYASASGMIVDVRPNAGGNEDIAEWFASHFTDEARTYGFYQYRNGPGHGDFGPLETKVLEPAAGSRFLGPVVCLTGQRNMSSAEWFVLMMSVCPNVTLMGDRTRGSSGNPSWSTLPNGVRYSVPRWMAYRPDHVSIEGNGVEPEIAIGTAASFDSEHDYVVERALSVLGAQ